MFEIKNYYYIIIIFIIIIIILSIDFITNMLSVVGLTDHN